MTLLSCSNASVDLFRKHSKADHIHFGSDFQVFAKNNAFFCCDAAFHSTDVKTGLSGYLSSKHMLRLRLVESGKYTHVSVFLNGDTDTAFFREDKILLLPSTDDKYDMIICNFADCYRAGDPGILNKVIRIAGAVNRRLSRIAGDLQWVGWMLITADRRNSAQVIDSETGRPHTAHADNPISRDCVDNDKALNTGNNSLHDLIRFVLSTLGVMRPVETTYRSLIKIA